MAASHAATMPSLYQFSNTSFREELMYLSLVFYHFDETMTWGGYEV